MEESQTAQNKPQSEPTIKKRTKRTIILLSVTLLLLVIIAGIVVSKYSLLFPLNTSQPQLVTQKQSVSQTPTTPTISTDNFKECKYQMPSNENVHTLKITQENISIIQLNTKNETVCKTPIYNFKSSGIETLQTMSKEEARDMQASIDSSIVYFINRSTFYFLNLDYRSKPVYQIPLYKASYYNVYSGGNQLLDNSKLEHFYVVEPVTFIGGCSDDESCKAFNVQYEKMNKNNDIYTTIIRTDGAYTQVQRNHLLNFNPSRFSSNENGLNFYKNDTSIMKSVPFSEFKKTETIQ